MAINLDLDESELTGAQRLRLRQERNERFRQTMLNSAHERYEQGRKNFIERNPNAVNPWERAQYLNGNAADTRGLMAHEREMLREKNAGELAVAEQKRYGMKEQGSDAARANAEAAQRAAELEWATKKEIASMDLEGKKYGADKDLEGKKYGFDMDLEGKKYGYDRDLEGKKYGADKNLEIAKTQGEYGVMQQAEANKGLTAQAEIKRQQQEQQIAATLEKAKIVAGGKVDAAKINSQAKTINTAIETGIAAGKDMATVMAELAKQYQGDSEMLEAISAVGGGVQTQQGVQPKEGDTKTLSSGTKVVFRNGQWVKA